MLLNVLIVGVIIFWIVIDVIIEIVVYSFFKYDFDCKDVIVKWEFWSWWFLNFIIDDCRVMIFLYDFIRGLIENVLCYIYLIDKLEIWIGIVFKGFEVGLWFVIVRCVG